MEELATARAVENSGLEGCAHARPDGKRQLLLVDVETLGSLNLVPGIIRENITTQGLDVNTLQVGQRLRMGSALLEVSAVCEPCALMETIRPALQQELQGRRGMLCRVLSGGALQRGDAIVLQSRAQRTAVGRGILRRWFAPQRGRVWRPILVLGLFFLLDRLLRRNNPLKRTDLAHSSLEEVRPARQERQNRPHEIGRIFTVGLLRLAALDQFDHLRKTLLGGLQARDAGIVLLN